MTKKLLYLFSTLLLTACAQDAEMLDFNELHSSSTARATVADFVPSSRTTITPTSSGMSFAWAEGDCLAVYGPSGTTMTNFEIDMESVSSDAKSADFSNCEFGLKQSSTYYAIYPADFSITNAHAYPLDYTGQTQNGNGTTAHLSAYDYLTAQGTAQSDNSVPFNLKHLGAIVRVTVTFDAPCTVSSISLKSEGAPFVLAGTTDITEETPSVTSTSTNATTTLNLEDVTLTSDNLTLVAYMLVSPVDLSGTTLTISAQVGDKTFKKSGIAGKNMLAGKAYAYSAGVTTQDYVDLQLPSGALWATCNLGADNPEDYGLYYQWGDTQGYTSNVSDGKKFDWTSCKYASGTSNELSALSKYCTVDTYWNGEGAMDNKTELDLEDDAVYQAKGAGWRIPSLTQWNELNSSSNCTKAWTTLNGVNGWMFTSKRNGNKLFLPAAGCRLNAKFQYSTTSGYYWSRTLYTSGPGYGCRLYFEDTEVITYYIGNYRYRGFSLRGVKTP